MKINFKQFVGITMLLAVLVLIMWTIGTTMGMVEIIVMLGIGVFFSCWVVLGIYLVTQAT